MQGHARQFLGVIGGVVWMGREPIGAGSGSPDGQRLRLALN